MQWRRSVSPARRVAMETGKLVGADCDAAIDGYLDETVLETVRVLVVVWCHDGLPDSFEYVNYTLSAPLAHRARAFSGEVISSREV